jgi:hypothetical protein
MKYFLVGSARSLPGAATIDGDLQGLRESRKFNRPVTEL